ncbi:ALF repeat-containing protein [Streptomyces lancefieldiae]
MIRTTGALNALKSRGPWLRQAAADALGGTDADMVTFLRTGWDTAVQKRP